MKRYVGYVAYNGGVYRVSRTDRLTLAQSLATFSSFKEARKAAEEWIEDEIDSRELGLAWLRSQLDKVRNLKESSVKELR